MVAVFGAAAIGFILLVLFVVFWRRMHSRVHSGSPYGGIYAETFALWLVVYVGLSRAFAFLPAGFPPALEMGLPQLLSLSVLGWPVLRGVPWRRVRQDIGWWRGRQAGPRTLFRHSLLLGGAARGASRGVGRVRGRENPPASRVTATCSARPAPRCIPSSLK